MKQRMGFVSNSSSSSFAVIVERAAYDEAFAKLSPWAQDIIKQISTDPKEFCKIPVVSLGYMDTHGVSSLDYLITNHLPTEEDKATYTDEWTEEDVPSIDLMIIHFLASINEEKKVTHNEDM